MGKGLIKVGVIHVISDKVIGVSSRPIIKHMLILAAE